MIQLHPRYEAIFNPDNIDQDSDRIASLMNVEADFIKEALGFSESEDKQVWGFSQKQIKQAEQTKPNPTTHKVDKWTGDWRSLQIDYHREKKLKMQVVKVPKK